MRQIDGFIVSLALPIMLMLTFVYLFGGAIHTGGAYVDYVVPGVLMVCLGFGTGNTAVAVAQDLSTAVIDRFRSMDVPSAALIGGHVATSVVRSLLSSALVLGLAFAIGFRSPAGPLSWLAALGVLSLFVVALSWLAAAAGVLTRSVQAASGITFFLSFLAYPSSAVVPISTMPSWLQGFARVQPMTPVIDTLRALLDGMPVGSAAWPAVAWSCGIVAASVVLATLLFRARTR
jgi:ABC-2 type transport system permease protein